MGQTLENGIYLPSEGERNCYAGLKTNWEILDQKVADVTALQHAVAGALHREIVESLPTTDIDPNTIYMVLSGTSATENVYNEFMYVNNAWELIGTSATDLTNYYTKAEVDGKLLLKASASDLNSHTGDTTIHVTTADKSKWNNGVSQSYVLRYSSSSVTDNSTIAYSTLDNTDNIKSGDKVIDVDGKIFSVVSVDTANQTVTVGSALIDLALDANVVHTSGNETVGGIKTFSDDIIRGTANTNSTIQSRALRGNTTVSTTGSNSSSYQSISATLNYSDSTPSKSISVNLYVNENAYADGKYNAFYPGSNNAVNLGISGKRWANVYATNYYYGSSDTEFSQKFVTTDTAQTITGTKTLDNVDLPFKNTAELGVSGGGTNITFSDKNGQQLCALKAITYSSGTPSFHFTLTQKVDNTIYTTNGIALYQTANSKVIQVRPTLANDNADGLSVWLGSSLNTFSRIYGLSYYYGSDNTEFSTKFVTTDTAQTISGNKTFSSINGVEPSSLSLPSGNSSDRIDISSYISDLSGTINVYTPPANGYLTFTFSSGSQVQIYPTSGMGLCSKWVAGSGSGIIRGFIPVLKNTEMKISVSATTMDSFYFIPCQGNV